MDSIRSIEDAVFKCPLPLLVIEDEKVRRTIDKYLPYSTGFEIECAFKDEDRVSSEILNSIFRQVPDVMSVDCTHSESRFRIPPGLKGLICLYKLCDLFKIHFHFTASGIHYHVDMTDWYDRAEDVADEFIEENQEWILNELDTWGYDGTFNPREIDRFYGSRLWVRFKQATKTCEIRIGEMSFDYEVLVKRIIHSNKIVRRLKGELFKFEQSRKLVTLEKKLEKLNKEDGEKEPLPPQEELKQFIKKRQVIVVANVRNRTNSQS